jgi:hypothetical protein
VDHNESQVRAVLDGLRGVLDDGDPQTVLRAPDARAVIDGAWDALHDVLADSSSHAAAELLTALPPQGGDPAYPIRDPKTSPSGNRRY